MSDDEWGRWQATFEPDPYQKPQLDAERLRVAEAEIAKLGPEALAKL